MFDMHNSINKMVICLWSVLQHTRLFYADVKLMSTESNPGFWNIHWLTKSKFIFQITSQGRKQHVLYCICLAVKCCPKIEISGYSIIYIQWCTRHIYKCWCLL